MSEYYGHSGWLGILILFLAIACTMVAIIHCIGYPWSGYSGNSIIRWCGETVEKNVCQKYSFDSVGVEEIEYGNVLIAHCVVYDYDMKNSFEVKVWVDPVASEPTVQNSGLVSDKYASGFVGL